MEDVKMLRTVGAYKKGNTYKVTADHANYWRRCGAASSGGPSKEDQRRTELNNMKRKELDELLTLYGSENPKKDYNNIKACVDGILEYEKPAPAVEADPVGDFKEQTKE